MAGRFSVDLAGQVALVTGGGDPVGQGIALALARSGAAVCVMGLNPDRLDHLVETIQAGGGRAMAWTGDVSNRFQVAAVIEAVREQFGGLPIVVNAAWAEKSAALLTVDEYDWRRVLEINLTGAFFATQLAGRVMADEGGGVIVNVFPAAGSGSENAAAAASQAGLAGFTHGSARSLAAHGVRVNGVSYAPGTPESVPAAVLFLCSEGAAFITGQVLRVDGGCILSGAQVE